MTRDRPAAGVASDGLAPTEDASGEEAGAGVAALLERVAIAEPAQAAPGGLALAEVLAAEHPTLSQRARVRLPGGAERWALVLAGVALRAGDRVLVASVAGCEEPVVTGVVDGFARRPERPARAAAALRLRPDEVVVVEAPDGAPLAELSARDGAVHLRLLGSGTSLASDGPLRLSGEAVTIEARRGDVTLEASDDVRVRGEVIKLNS